MRPTTATSRSGIQERSGSPQEREGTSSRSSESLGSRVSSHSITSGASRERHRPSVTPPWQTSTRLPRGVVYGSRRLPKGAPFGTRPVSSGSAIGRRGGGAGASTSRSRLRRDHGRGRRRSVHAHDERQSCPRHQRWRRREGVFAPRESDRRHQCCVDWFTAHRALDGDGCDHDVVRLQDFQVLFEHDHRRHHRVKRNWRRSARWQHPRVSRQQAWSGDSQLQPGRPIAQS